MKFRGEGADREVFDPVRKKYVKLTPEEGVRQAWIAYLNEHLGYPINLMEVERKVEINGMNQRLDLLCRNSEGDMHLLVECKAPDVKIDQSVFDQAARYNTVLRAPYLLVSNGETSYIAKIDFEEQNHQFVEEIPAFTQVGN
jgi:hypothetical protein